MFGGYVSHAKKEYIHRYEGMYSLTSRNTLSVAIVNVAGRVLKLLI